MKKLSYILSTLLIAASSAFFSSCGENKDFWGPHTLTDDEIAEQERQEEIKRQQRERIDAGLILNYTVEFFISGNSYDGGDVKIDMDKIASEFGISKDALGTALNGDGGADVTGFAIWRLLGSLVGQGRQREELGRRGHGLRRVRIH